MPPVTFRETVDLASLPREEYKDAHNARKGQWGPAPLSDELWDGERRRFWERELTTEELKEIQKFRQKARYAAMFLGINGVFGLKLVHMPKVPPIIMELVNLSVQQQQTLAASSGGIPPPSPDVNTQPVQRSDSKKDESPTAQAMKQPSYDAIYHAHVTEFFEYSNPMSDPIRVVDAIIDPSPPNSTTTTTTDANGTSPTKEVNSHLTSSGSDSPSAGKRDSAKRLSFSQQAAIKGAGKVLKVDSSSTTLPRLGAAIHQSRNSIASRRRAHSEELEKKRMRKRKQIHPILQPWYVVLYFLFPVFLLSSYYGIMWLSNDVYSAWTSNKAIKWAIEVPWIIERILRIPDNAFLKSTVYVGLFAVEVTTLLYLLLLIGSNVTIFLVFRPLLQGLLSSFGEYRGAAKVD